MTKQQTKKTQPGDPSGLSRNGEVTAFSGPSLAVPGDASGTADDCNVNNQQQDVKTRGHGSANSGSVIIPRTVLLILDERTTCNRMLRSKMRRRGWWREQPDCGD